jgi:hypothetical protein
VGITLRELIYDFGGGMLDDSTSRSRAWCRVDRPRPFSAPIASWSHRTPNTRCTPGTARARSTCPWAWIRIAPSARCSAPPAPSSWTRRSTWSRPRRNLMRFYKHESCGQCTPCREGTGWLVDVLNNLREGRGKRERRRSARRHREQHDGQHDLRASPKVPRCPCSDSSASSPRSSSSSAATHPATKGARARRFASSEARMAWEVPHDERRRWSAALRDRGCIAVATPWRRVTMKSPLRAAMALLGHIISFAGLYLTLQRPLPGGAPDAGLRGRCGRALRVHHHAHWPRRA